MQISAQSGVKKSDKLSIKETELDKWEDFTKEW